MQHFSFRGPIVKETVFYVLLEVPQYEKKKIIVFSKNGQ